MAPTRTAKNSTPAGTHASSSENEDEGIPQTVYRLLDKASARRIAARKKLDQDVAKAVDKARTAIDTFYAERKSNVTPAQKAKYDELSALLKARRAIMTRIFATQNKIKAETRQVSKELAAVYRGRIEDIQELDNGSQSADE